MEVEEHHVPAPEWTKWFIEEVKREPGEERARASGQSSTGPGKEGGKSSRKGMKGGGEGLAPGE